VSLKYCAHDLTSTRTTINLLKCIISHRRIILSNTKWWSSPSGLQAAWQAAWQASPLHVYLKTTSLTALALMPCRPSVCRQVIKPLNDGWHIVVLVVYREANVSITCPRWAIRSHPAVAARQDRHRLYPAARMLDGDTSLILHRDKLSIRWNEDGVESPHLASMLWMTRLQQQAIIEKNHQVLKSQFAPSLEELLVWV
jgi:hypothetical protein